MPFAVRNLPATLSDAGFHSQQGFRLMARCLRLRCRHAVDAARRRRVWDPTDALSPSLPASAARGYDALLRDPLEGQQPASAGRALFGSRRIAHSATKFGIRLPDCHDCMLPTVPFDMRERGLSRDRTRHTLRPFPIPQPRHRLCAPGSFAARRCF